MRVVINEGTSFFIGNEAGNSFGKESGLYYQDTRFLKKFKLFINGRAPVVLSTKNIDHYSSIHHLTNLTTKKIPRNSLTIKRAHFVGRGLHADIDITNYLDEEAEFTLSLQFRSDFADIFEVKQDKVRKRDVEHKIVDKSLVYSYKAKQFLRKTIVKIENYGTEPDIEEDTITFKIKIAPKKTWHTCVVINISMTEKAEAPLYNCKDFGVFRPEFDQDIEHFLNKAPYLESNNHELERSFGRAKRDLASLALRVETDHGSVLVPAAGIPWFVTLFGRDSIIAGLQSLILTPMFAKGALLALASRQGKAVNDFNKEQPGAIVHEVRFGELAVMREVPHALYYATIDATPLFLMLIGEYFKWTADIDLIRLLEPNIKAALNWIDKYGDVDDDGYVEYRDKSISWKDSFDSIVHSNGQLATPPIAVSEVQGYVYAAKMAIADIYKHLGQEKSSSKLIKEANVLKRQFNKDFWMEDKGFYALALDQDKKQVKSICSNAGHLLYCGIVPKDRAGRVIDRLMKEDMFSGWGIRTITKKNRGYNPISYHKGSIWPHDNAIIAAGIRKYGFKKNANKIIEGLIEASNYFDFNRLPELFCGYDRKGYSFPVDYPTSSSPQAWAASSIPFFLSVLLGIEPRAHDGEVVINPSLLPKMNYLGVHGVIVGKSLLNIHVRKKDRRFVTDVSVVRGKKINLKIF